MKLSIASLAAVLIILLALPLFVWAEPADTSDQSSEVRQILPEKVEISAKEFTKEEMLLSVHEVEIGSELHLSAIIEPSNVTQTPNFLWSSSNPSVLDVNSKGVAIAKEEGDATVILNVGSLTAKMSFSVLQKNPPSVARYLLMGFGALVLIIIIYIIFLCRRISKRRRLNHSRSQQTQRPERPQRPQRPQPGQAPNRSREARRPPPQRRGEAADRNTRVYNVPDLSQRAPDSSHRDVEYRRANVEEKDSPFSIDDIK